MQPPVSPSLFLLSSCPCNQASHSIRSVNTESTVVKTSKCSTCLNNLFECMCSILAGPCQHPFIQFCAKPCLQRNPDPCTPPPSHACCSHLCTSRTLSRTPPWQAVRRVLANLPASSQVLSPLPLPGPFIVPVRRKTYERHDEAAPLLRDTHQVSRTAALLHTVHLL